MAGIKEMQNTRGQCPRCLWVRVGSGESGKKMCGRGVEGFGGKTVEQCTVVQNVGVTGMPDKDVEEPKKKRVAEETLLQESFKKLKVVEVSGSESTQETPSNDPKEMSEEDVQSMLEIFLVEDLVALWSLVKEKSSSAVPSVDKEKALWVELRRLFEPDADDVLLKLQRRQCNGQRSSVEDLHRGQQTKEQKFRYILQVIKMIKLKKLDVLLGINAAGSSITAAGSRLMLLGKVNTAAEVVKEITLSS
uniref:Uncharacterized protein n=1 Tax=Tanacetum cinerariifolium TaxID=118510 RepID=A0A699HN60_TANCI|nr:hypothetical protein [Tanacetum cinerariifolium]